ncbi:MAG: 2-amino-5-formylamino-6-ribosylaminopyrimidin-4(3H)-one 5'-monophosphate deformylase [Candidatus Hadarchaeales archaeon]
MKLGVLALGSVNEKHGAILPPDTDLRLATHVAREISKRVGAMFIGSVASSCEYPEIETGEHQSVETVLNDLKKVLRKAKEINVDTVIIVNGHGGNNLLKPELQKLERELDLTIIFCDSLLKLEGPHAWSGEVSAGLWLGFADMSKICDHIDFRKFPEVGFVGLMEARKKYPWVEKMAREVEEEEIRASLLLGKVIIECAVRDIIQTVEELGS